MQNAEPPARVPLLASPSCEARDARNRVETSVSLNDGRNDLPRCKNALAAMLQASRTDVCSELVRTDRSSRNMSSADDILRELRSVLTSSEQTSVRLACNIAASAFLHRGKSLRPSFKETDVSTLLRASLASHEGLANNGTRAGGSAFCMSGPNSAEAYAAYQRSRAREIQ